VNIYIAHYHFEEIASALMLRPKFTSRPLSLWSNSANV